MSRKFIIQATDIGADVEHLDIYYNTISPTNLIVSGADPAILTGSGYTVIVPDDTTAFYGYASGGLCDGITGSLVVSADQVNTRYFNLYISGSGEVSILSPYEYPGVYTSSGNFEVPVEQIRMNYSDVLIGFGGLLAIQGSATYPSVVEGFYKATPFNSSTLILTGSVEDTTLTIVGQNDQPDVSDIYVVFSD